MRGVEQRECVHVAGGLDQFEQQAADRMAAAMSTAVGAASQAFAGLA